MVSRAGLSALWVGSNRWASIFAAASTVIADQPEMARATGLLGATAIGNQYTVGVAQVLHHIVAQVVANQVGIPRRTLREVL